MPESRDSPSDPPINADKTEQWIWARQQAEQGVPQSEIARQIGRSKSTISAWISGKVRPGETRVKPRIPTGAQNKASIKNGTRKKGQGWTPSQLVDLALGKMHESAAASDMLKDLAKSAQEKALEILAQDRTVYSDEELELLRIAGQFVEAYSSTSINTARQATDAHRHRLAETALDEADLASLKDAMTTIEFPEDATSAQKLSILADHQAVLRAGISTQALKVVINYLGSLGSDYLPRDLDDALKIAALSQKAGTDMGGLLKTADYVDDADPNPDEPIDKIEAWDVEEKSAEEQS